jgi:hypothetical protein
MHDVQAGTVKKGLRDIEFCLFYFLENIAPTPQDCLKRGVTSNTACAGGRRERERERESWYNKGLNYVFSSHPVTGCNTKALVILLIPSLTLAGFCSLQSESESESESVAEVDLPE